MYTQMTMLGIRSFQKATSGARQLRHAPNGVVPFTICHINVMLGKLLSVDIPYARYTHNEPHAAQMANTRQVSLSATFTLH